MQRELPTDGLASNCVTSLEMINKCFPSNHSDNSLQHMQRELPNGGLASNCATSLEMNNKHFPGNHSDNSLQHMQRKLPSGGLPDQSVLSSRDKKKYGHLFRMLRGKLREVQTKVKQVGSCF